jgi:hypothetical protein
MIGSFVRWLRLTLPPLWAVFAAILLLLGSEGLYFWSRSWFDLPDTAYDPASPLLELRDKVAAMIMAAYGVFRVAAFHPFFRPRYRGWLEQTPWTSRKPLPLGPIHLVWQDVIVVGILLMCLHGTPLGRVWAMGAFLLTYLAALGVSFWITGPWWMGYVVLSGMGLAVRMANWPFVYVGLLLVVYAIAVMGRGMALARFPWPESDFIETLNRQFRSNSAAQRKSLLGWPFGQLSGVQPKRAVRLRDGILGPLLAAWWVYAVAAITPDAEARTAGPSMIFFFVTTFAVFIRPLVYIGPCRPPISHWGRVMTGRWIIPGYDCVFVAPLCTLLVVLIGETIGILAGSADWATIVYPLTMAAALIVALNMGPSLGRWRLTGHHRIVPWSVNDPQRVKL